MQLERIVVEAFGKLNQLSLELHPNFNLIYGPNEVGKSTLQQVILHLIYGFYQSNRATPQETALLERYRPWQKSSYSGQLFYKLKNKNCYQVNRDFSDPDISTQVFDTLTGEDITNQFVEKRHGNISFMKDQIGMEKDLFESTVFVRQAEVKAIAGSSYLVNEVIGVIDSGSKDKSAKNAIAILQQAITQIGSDRAQKRPLPQAKKRYEILKEEFETQDRAREDLKQAIIQKNLLTKQIDKENTHRIDLNYQILTKSIDLKEKQLYRLQSLKKELKDLESQIKEFADVAEFPEELQETIIRRRQNRKNYEEQKQEKNHTLVELKEQEKLIKKEMGHLNIYESICSLMPYREYVNLKNQWRQRNQILVEAQTKVDQEELFLLENGVDPKSLQELSNLNSADFSNFQQKEEEIKELEEQNIDSQRQLDQLESQTWASGKVRNLIIYGTAILTFIVLTLSYLFKFIYGYPGASALMVIGLIIFLFYRKAREKIAQHANSLEDLLRTNQQDIETKRHDLNKFYQRFGVESINELMTRRMQNEHYLRLVVDRDKAFKEQDRIEFQLLKYLQSIKVQEINDQILERVDKDYNQFSSLFDKINFLQQEVSQIEKSIENLKNKLFDNDEALKELLSQVNVHSTDIKTSEENFDHLLQRKKQLKALSRGREKLKSELTGVLSSQSESDIHNDLEDLVNRRELLLANHPNILKKENVKKLLQLEKDFSEIDLSRQRHEKELQALQTRIETVLEQHRPKAEIEEEMSQVQSEMTRLEKLRTYLELAKNILTKVALNYHRNVVPFINTVLSETMDKITDNRYTEIYINPDDLSLNLNLPEKKTLGSANLLSLGTQEQLYLLLRVALAQLLSQNMEPMPLILDDPFVHFDHKRMGNMLLFLTEMSQNNQILLFTKEPFIIDWCKKTLDDGSFLIFELQNLVKSEL